MGIKRTLGPCFFAIGILLSPLYSAAKTSNETLKSSAKDQNEKSTGNNAPAKDSPVVTWGAIARDEAALATPQTKSASRAPASYRPKKKKTAAPKVIETVPEQRAEPTKEPVPSDASPGEEESFGLTGDWGGARKKLMDHGYASNNASSARLARHQKMLETAMRPKSTALSITFRSRSHDQSNSKASCAVVC